MTKKQAKKLYGTEGTKRIRKQWQVARNKGKTPNKHLHEENNHNIANDGNIPIIGKKSIKRYLHRLYKNCKSGSLYRSKKTTGLREINVAECVNNTIAVIYAHR
jgi:hypothetical protein